MIKNEKELQTWMRTFLNDSGVYARKLETPFARGWSDLYTAHKGRVTWIECKWLGILSPIIDRKKLAAKCIGLPTPLQRKFLEEQNKNGVGAIVAAGYYLDDETIKTRKPPLYFVIEKYPSPIPFVKITPDGLIHHVMSRAT